MDRRTFVASAGAAAISAAFLPEALLAQTRRMAPGAGSSDAALNAIFDRIFEQILERSPEQATSLGLDKGPNGGRKPSIGCRSAPSRRGGASSPRPGRR